MIHVEDIAKTDDLRALTEMIDDGTLTPVVGTTYPLAETGAAVARAGSGHARGKVVVAVG